MSAGAALLVKSDDLEAEVELLKELPLVLFIFVFFLYSHNSELKKLLIHVQLLVIICFTLSPSPASDLSVVGLDVLCHYDSGPRNSPHMRNGLLRPLCNSKFFRKLTAK